MLVLAHDMTFADKFSSCMLIRRYRQARGFNKTAAAILVGTKYDNFASFSPEEQAELTKQARRYAKAMKAPLIFSSASHSINVQKVNSVLHFLNPSILRA
jgi:hypothetical protein